MDFSLLTNYLKRADMHYIKNQQAIILERTRSVILSDDFSNKSYEGETFSSHISCS